LIERNLLISLLKLTKNNSVDIETVNLDAKLPRSTTLKLLKMLQNQELITMQESIVEVSVESRLKMAIKAINLGADVERISDLLCWQEFEEMAALALMYNGYVTKKNVRFKQVRKRWEIDVVGCRKPLVICIDCKHYHHSLHPAMLRKMVDLQVKRVEAFSQILPDAAQNIECVKWGSAKFVPAILSLMPGSLKFIDNVPIVPVLQFQDFLSQLPIHVNSLTYFSRSFSHL